MYEITNTLGVSFIIRSESVDKDTLDWMSQSLFIRALFDTNLTRDDITIDLGSHIGSFALPAVLHKQCKAICFEPDTESLVISKASATLNNLDHLVAFHQCAVGGTDGNILLNQSDQNWGHTIIENGGPCNKLTGIKHEVPLVSLDTVLRCAPETACLFVKFNTEGAEFEMFKNASIMALGRIGSLVGEVHYDLGLGDFDPCISRLQDAGFIVTLVPQGETRSILIGRRAKP